MARAVASTEAIGSTNGDLEDDRRQARCLGRELLSELKRGMRALGLARFGELEARLHEAAAEPDLAPRWLSAVQVGGAPQGGQRTVSVSCQSFGICEALQPLHGSPRPARHPSPRRPSSTWDAEPPPSQPLDERSSLRYGARRLHAA